MHRLHAHSNALHLQVTGIAPPRAQFTIGFDAASRESGLCLESSASTEPAQTMPSSQTRRTVTSQ